jgi:hypothetical protein
MHHGTDYLCTGHAHFKGEHIRCTSEAHATDGLPADLLRVLRDPSITVPQDTGVWSLKEPMTNPAQEGDAVEERVLNGKRFFDRPPDRCPNCGAEDFHRWWTPNWLVLKARPWCCPDPMCGYESVSVLWRFILRVRRIFSKPTPDHA